MGAGEQREVKSVASPTSTFLLTKNFFPLVFNIRGCVEEVARIQSARGKGLVALLFPWGAHENLDFPVVASLKIGGVSETPQLGLSKRILPRQWSTPRCPHPPGRAQAAGQHPCTRALRANSCCSRARQAGLSGGKVSLVTPTSLSHWWETTNIKLLIRTFGVLRIPKLLSRLVLRWGAGCGQGSQETVSRAGTWRSFKGH